MPAEETEGICAPAPGGAGRRVFSLPRARTALLGLSKVRSWHQRKTAPQGAHHSRPSSPGPWMVPKDGNDVPTLGPWAWTGLCKSPGPPRRFRGERAVQQVKRPAPALTHCIRTDPTGGSSSSTSLSFPGAWQLLVTSLHPHGGSQSKRQVKVSS